MTKPKRKPTAKCGQTLIADIEGLKLYRTKPNQSTAEDRLRQIAEICRLDAVSHHCNMNGPMTEILTDIYALAKGKP